jgi:hypothetical protein
MREALAVDVAIFVPTLIRQAGPPKRLIGMVYLEIYRGVQKLGSGGSD